VWGRALWGSYGAGCGAGTPRNSLGATIEVKFTIIILLYDPNMGTCGKMWGRVWGRRYGAGCGARYGAAMGQDVGLGAGERAGAAVEVKFTIITSLYDPNMAVCMKMWGRVWGRRYGAGCGARYGAGCGVGTPRNNLGVAIEAKFIIIISLYDPNMGTCGKMWGRLWGRMWGRVWGTLWGSYGAGCGAGTPRNSLGATIEVKLTIITSLCDPNMAACMKMWGRMWGRRYGAGCGARYGAAMGQDVGQLWGRMWGWHPREQPGGDHEDQVHLGHPPLWPQAGCGRGAMGQGAVGQGVGRAMGQLWGRMWG